MRCPVCGSRNVTKLKTGSYKCNDCGFVFYPDREAIIDLRDLIDADELSDEEIEVIGERIKTASEDMGKKLYGENVSNVFRKDVTMEDIVTRYNEEEHLYGVFIDFKDDISGTLLIIIPDSDIGVILSKYEGGVIQSLKQLAKEAFEEFKNNLSWNAEITGIDIAYDNISSMLNFLTSEIGRNKTVLMLNYQFISQEKWRGEMIFVPSKNSLGMLRRII